jgi:pimeloyl-ACP methyl ester carboxylesterase
MSPKRSALRIGVYVACSFAALYVALMVAAFFGQRALIYPAPSPRDPRVAGATLERISGPNGSTVYALYAEAPPGAPTLVLFHGNAEDLAHQAWLVQAIRRTGLGVYAVEYPGYGLARGSATTEEAVYSAAESALGHLYELGVLRGSVVLLGQSLGTGVAAEMAHRGHGSRMILISPYTSMVEMAARAAPFLPVSWLVRDRYETYRKVPTLSMPVLIIHGTDDEVVPFEMGQRIAALTPNRQLLPISGAHHNDLFDGDEHHLVGLMAAFARDSSVEPH